MTEHYRARDARDFHHDFDTRNHERDVSRELSNRTDAILRDREALMSRMGGATPSHQDLRYPHPPPGERAYPGQRSHTPISRSEHPQHPSFQHGPPHSILTDGGHPAYGQRQQEEPAHRYREAFPPRDERGLVERIREEQHQQARMRGLPPDDYMSQMRGRERELRDRELRDQNARYHDDLLRRDSRLPPAGPAGGPSHVQPGHEQRPPLGGPPDWTSAVRGHHEQQQKQQQQQRSWQR
jgi:serine/arginine repetitive matrix protein 2